MEEYHCLIGGTSGGGKTTLLREIHEEADCISIWINHNDESDVAGHRAKGRPAMHTATGRYKNWSDVRINLKGDNPLEMVALAVDFAVDVWDTAGIPCQIIVDESHHVIGEKLGSPRDNAGFWILAEGRDRGIKGVFATQNPQTWDYDYLLNARYWAWCGEYASAQKGFLNYWGFDLETMPDSRYEYNVYDRQMEKLYSDTTKQQYADGK